MKDRLTRLEEAAKSLLAEKTRQKEEAEKLAKKAEEDYREAAKAAQIALDEGKEKAYLEAAAAADKAKYLAELARDKAAKAAAVTDDEKRAAADLYAGLLEELGKLDRKKQEELLERLHAIREEAETVAGHIVLTNKLGEKLYKTFLNATTQPTLYEGKKLAAIGIDLCHLENRTKGVGL